MLDGYAHGNMACFLLHPPPIPQTRLAFYIPTSCQFVEYGPMSYGTIMLNEGRKYPIFTRDFEFTSGQRLLEQEKKREGGRK